MDYVVMYDNSNLQSPQVVRSFPDEKEAAKYLKYTATSIQERGRRVIWQGNWKFSYTSHQFVDCVWYWIQRS